MMYISIFVIITQYLQLRCLLRFCSHNFLSSSGLYHEKIIHLLQYLTDVILLNFLRPPNFISDVPVHCSLCKFKLVTMTYIFVFVIITCHIQVYCQLSFCQIIFSRSYIYPENTLIILMSDGHISKVLQPLVQMSPHAVVSSILMIQSVVTTYIYVSKFILDPMTYMIGLVIIMCHLGFCSLPRSNGYTQKISGHQIPKSIYLALLDII